MEAQSSKNKPGSLDESINNQNGLFVESTKYKNRLVVNQTGSREDIVFSCRNRCGRFLNLPCSCDVICEVYRNCCEDFFKECELITAKEESRYKFYQNITIECSSDNMLLISSCNKNSDQKKTSSEGQFQKIDIWDGTNAGSHTWTLKKIFQNTPVTDSVSRLAFKDKSTFDCNSHFSSIPLMWIALLDHLEITENDHNYYISLNEKYTPTFAPPRHMNEFLQPHQCIPHSIGDCSISKYKDLCSSFTSYVKAENMLVYDNAYCAQCAGWNDTSLLMPVTFVGRGSRPKISMSSSLNFDTVTFQTEDNTSSQSWQTLVCSLDQEARNQLKCQITACNSFYYKFDNGQCLQLSVFSVAFFNLGVTPSSEEQPKISDYIMCLLKYYSKIILLGEWKPAQIFYYPQVYFQSNFLFYPSTDSIKIFNMLINRFDFYRLISISKLLKIKLGRNKYRKETFKSLKGFEEMYTDKEHEELLVDVSLEKVSTNLVDEYNTTTVCACTISLIMAEIISFYNSQICNYTCLKTPVYTRPATYDNMCPLYDVFELNAFKRLQTDIFASFVFTVFWFVR